MTPTAAVIAPSLPRMKSGQDPEARDAVIVVKEMSDARQSCGAPQQL